MKPWLCALFMLILAIQCSARGTEPYQERKEDSNRKPQNDSTSQDTHDCPQLPMPAPSKDEMTGWWKMEYVTKDALRECSYMQFSQEGQELVFNFTSMYGHPSVIVPCRHVREGTYNCTRKTKYNFMQEITLHFARGPDGKYLIGIFCSRTVGQRASPPMGTILSPEKYNMKFHELENVSKILEEVGAKIPSEKLSICVPFHF